MSIRIFVAGGWILLVLASGVGNAARAAGVDEGRAVAGVEAETKKAVDKKADELAKDTKPADDAKSKDKESKDEKAKDEKAKDKPAEDKKVDAKKTDEPSRPAADDKAGETTGETCTVKKGPVEIEVEIEGKFEAQQMSEVIVRLDEWGSLSVITAVPHGTRVKRGDVLVTLDMEDIDQAIEDLREELKVASLSMKQAEQELRALEKTTPLDIAAAERGNRETHEDVEHYKKTDRPMRVKLNDFFLKLYEQWVEESREELTQLEKMYKADDLTEETEEIVLKRARHQLEMAEFFYNMTKVGHVNTIERELPRSDQRIEEGAKRADIDYERAKIALPSALESRKLEFEKAKIQHQRNQRKLERLLADRAAMTVKAPADGILYYGQCERGKWSGASGEELKRGSSLSANSVVMTIVEPRPLFVHMTVPEKELHQVRVGMPCKVKPTAFPERKLKGIVARVGQVPMTGGDFDGRVTLELGDEAEGLMPGMNACVKVQAYHKKDALVVPAGALKADDVDDAKQYVFVVADGKTTKREVKVGRKTDEKVEILAGLTAGEKILAKAPEADEDKCVDKDEKAGDEKKKAEKSGDDKSGDEKKKAEKDDKAGDEKKKAEKDGQPGEAKKKSDSK